jgi:hypothetical protein
MTTILAQKADGEQLAEIFADKIGIPLDEWYGNCHVVSLAIVRSGLLHGPADARVRVARGTCLGIYSQHSWISLGDPYSLKTEYVDPTSWCWTEGHPAIWTGKASQGDRIPHGTGSIWSYGKPVHQGGPTVKLTPATPLSFAARSFLDLVEPLDVRGWLVLANAPVGGWPAGEIFSAISDTEALGAALVPIDVLGMATDRNPEELYW